jgi:hypothetical protein
VTADHRPAEEPYLYLQGPNFGPRDFGLVRTPPDLSRWETRRWLPRHLRTTRRGWTRASRDGILAAGFRPAESRLRCPPIALSMPRVGLGRPAVYLRSRNELRPGLPGHTHRVRSPARAAAETR